MSIRIKICGITRQADADAAVGAGADAVGLNFAEASPRRLDLPQARRLSAHLGGTAVRVGVFADAAPDEIHRVLDAVELDVLQFHGSEPGTLCRSFGLPFIKALRMREPLPLEEVQEEYAGACCLLLDTYVPGKAGGTGEVFDWRLWPDAACRPVNVPLVLAGGLTPENVGHAVAQLDPWGVDVSGGVEGPVKGEKDPDKIRRFVEEVKRARS